MDKMDLTLPPQDEVDYWTRLSVREVTDGLLEMGAAFLGSRNQRKVEEQLLFPEPYESVKTRRW